MISEVQFGLTKMHSTYTCSTYTCSMSLCIKVERKQWKWWNRMKTLWHKRDDRSH